MSLSLDEQARYHRHLILDGFGPTAQERLRAASVLCVGAGGLGSPALLYLAAAGVGRIGIIDDDVVDRSNLQRQVIHRDRDVGCAKTASAARAIADLDPGVSVETHQMRLDASNARELIARYDVVLDGADNFPTRYLVNDAAVLSGRPAVHGAVFGFEGQVTVFAPKRGGPCYRCLFPQAPAPGSVPSCSEAGVLGVLPGMVGIAMATEAIKLLCGIGEPLIGRLLRFDALSMRWLELAISPDPACPLCGANPSIHEVEAIAWDTCEWVPELLELSPAAYAALRTRGEEHLLLDVREAAEIAAGAISGHRHLPLGELPQRLDELADWRHRLVVCQCQGGVRSRRAASLLIDAGFRRVADLNGGWLAWRREQAASTNS